MDDKAYLDSLLMKGADEANEAAEQTRAVIERATGGVLFIDEAYTLVKKGAEKDFGVEALEELMRAMDEGGVVMIYLCRV